MDLDATQRGHLKPAQPRLNLVYFPPSLPLLLFPNHRGSVTSGAPSSWAYGFEQRASALCGCAIGCRRTRALALSMPGSSDSRLRRWHVPLCISCVRSSPVGAMTRQQPTMHHTSPTLIISSTQFTVNVMIDTSQTLSPRGS